MGTGDLGSFKDTPAGKAEGSFVTSLIGASMVGDNLAPLLIGPSTEPESFC